MKTRLTHSLKSDQKKQLEGEFKASLQLRRRLQEILRSDMEAIHAKMRDEALYEEGNWAYKQASKIGETKALHKLISLLE